MVQTRHFSHQTNYWPFRLPRLFVSLFLLVLLTACQQQTSQLDEPGQLKLQTLSVDKIDPVADYRAYRDPAYGTKIHKATSAEDGQSRMRHEYSRRQAFNADNSRLLAQDGSGHWFLYETEKLSLVKPLTDLVGDAEPIWHASRPELLYFTSRSGGLIWWSLDVETGDKQVLIDLTTTSPWPEATAYWTKGEGTTSADGRYLTLLASHYEASSQENHVYGIVLLDLVERRIVGQLDARDFPTPYAMPDHVSTAPSGRFALVSWQAQDGGTVAYSSDFSSWRQLIAGTEHSDLAIGRQGEDLLVYTDYQLGQIRSIALATGEAQDLYPLYPAEGEAYAAHISGQAFDRPGWVVVSTYGDYADYGDTRPAEKLRPPYRKVWLLELAAGGRRLNLAHIRAKPEKVGEEEAYFLEPQASVSRDLTRVVFASNMDGPIESYVITLPEGLLDEE